MTKRPKEAQGKKLIYRYEASVIFTILFSLLAIGVFVASLLFPYATIEGKEPLTGFEFFNVIIHLFTGEANLLMNSYVEDIVFNVFDSFWIATPIINVMIYILAFNLFMMGFFAVLTAIATLIMLFTGRLKIWKMPYSMVKRMFITSIFYYGVILLINIYSLYIKDKVVPEAAPGVAYDTMYSMIFFGALLVITIVLHIIWHNAFKDQLYVKNEKTLNKYLDEIQKENVVITDTSKEHQEDEVIIEKAPKPAPVVVPSNDQTIKNESSDNRRRLPKGLKNIGGHAFSQNTALEEADIPLGIEVLGPGAFANCVNLKVVYIPESVKRIEYNCFFNCIKLERITYGGSREMWKKIKRGSNWLTSAGTKFVVCRDGALLVNQEK